MKNLFQAQLEINDALPAASDKFQHLASTLRSIYQAAAVVALEATLELTPEAHDNPSIASLVRRFVQPSDGLPVDVLEVCTPAIRSAVDRSYHRGWFEVDPVSGDSLAVASVAWVGFRNKKPGHGVVSKADIEEWLPRMRALAGRCLACFGPWLPAFKSGQQLSVSIGGSSLGVRTPLVRDGLPIVISGVDSKRGVWKIEGQTLGWEQSQKFVEDLPAGSVFQELADEYPQKFCIRPIDFRGAESLVFSNVPSRQTSVFEGREDELKTIASWLNDEESLPHCLVFGDGGIGKTTLVLEFLNRVLEGDETLTGNPPSVISYYSAKMTRWTDHGVEHIRGVSDAMEDSIRELLFVLTPVISKDYYKLHGAALVDRIAGDFNKQGFKRNDILLVIDNTETLATSPQQVTEFNDFVKQVGRRLGRVLMTSRRREHVAFEPVPISSLSEGEAVSLLRRLAEEYGAIAIRQAGDSTLRRAANQLSRKPLLLDTLVKYLARSTSGIDHAIEMVFRKTNDELLEFLYDDAWLRISDLQQDAFLVLVSASVPLDGHCVADACALVGVQHVEFQKALDETYFATVTDYGDRYELQIVTLAARFFQKKLQNRSAEDRQVIKEHAQKVDSQANRRQQVDQEYRQDRVAEAFRGEFAKAAKVAAEKGDLEGAEQSYRLALEEDPMNAALHDRFAWFTLHRLRREDEALKLAERATELDPHNADASLTKALTLYRLGKLEEGDEEIQLARRKGKPESLCALRKAIARYHAAKLEVESERASMLITEGKSLIASAIRQLSAGEKYFGRNIAEARKYERLFQDLEYRNRSR